MPLPKDEEKLAVTIDEAARLLSIGRGFMYRMVKEGKIPVKKFGRSSRIAMSDVRAFLNDPDKGGDSGNDQRS